MTAVLPIRIKGRELGPHKATVAPLLGARNALTNNPWTFVTLWLRRNNKTQASFYWNQAYEFYKASMGLPLHSAPLGLYYCFMNAAKALLVAKGIPFDERHGVGSYNMRKPTSKINIGNEGVRIFQKGIVPSLSSYYGETEIKQTHSLQELFFNMAFIHRTYCLTYTSQPEMFVPLATCAYVSERSSKQAYFSAQISKDVNMKHVIKRLPTSLLLDPSSGPRAIRSASSVSCSKPSNATLSDLNGITKLHRQLRSDLHYINGAQTLWYVKGIISGPARIARQGPTTVLAAMHRLSEICRYRPLELDSHLSSQRNWLLSEFIHMSPSQFIDEIASELTGHQFLMPNLRAPA